MTQKRQTALGGWFDPDLRGEYVARFGWGQLGFDLATMAIEATLRLVRLALVVPVYLTIYLPLLLVKGALDVMYAGLVRLTDLKGHFWRRRAFLKLDIQKGNENRY